MSMSASTRDFLDRALSVLPTSEDDLLLSGITFRVTARMTELKGVILSMKSKHGSLESLEKEIEKTGVSPDDHTLYTDMLEWKAADFELSKLVDLLGSV